MMRIMFRAAVSAAVAPIHRLWWGNPQREPAGGRDGRSVSGVGKSEHRASDGGSGRWARGWWIPTRLPSMRIRLRAVAAILVTIPAMVGGWAATANAGSGWQPTGSMSTGRNAHGSALLNDGRVLAVSGFGGSGEVPVADLFDPETGTWTVAAPPLVPRHYATVTTLSNGRVLVTGGFTASGVTNHAELYDPAANTWTATGAMLEPRNGHMAVRLNDGRVLVTGGADGARNASATAEIYDPATGTWTPAGTMAVARENHQATRLADGRVLVAGGFHLDQTTTFTASSEIYDPGTGDWTTVTPMATERGQMAGGLLPDGTVLTANGVNRQGFVTAAERFDPVTGTWSSAGTTGIRGNVAFGTVLRDGRFLLTTDGDQITPLYDPTAVPSAAWSARYSFGVLRAQPSITRLDDGRVLLAGGTGTGGVRLPSAEIFTPPTERGATGGAFPELDVRAEREQDVTLTNEGGNPLWIDGTAITGPDAGDFTVVSDACGGETLQPAGTCVVRVRFSPSAVGARSAELTVDDNAETSPAVELTGTGRAETDDPEPPVDREPPLDPEPPVTTPATANPIAPAPSTVPAPCSRRFVTLAGIAPTSANGTRLRLTGVAAASLAGKPVRVERNGRRVGTTRVARDGRIDATVRTSKRDRTRRTDRYRLVIAGEARSRALKATRRVSADRTVRQADGGVVVSGRIRDARGTITLTLRSDAVCGPKTRRVAVRTDARGRFRVTLPAPPAGSPATIHRLWWGSRSVSLPVVVAAR